MISSTAVVNARAQPPVLDPPLSVFIMWWAERAFITCNVKDILINFYYGFGNVSKLLSCFSMLSHSFRDKNLCNRNFISEGSPTLGLMCCINYFFSLNYIYNGKWAI